MAVVIKPTENRLAMAKPPPKKLDEREANKINEGRKQGWNSEWTHNFWGHFEAHLMVINIGGNGFFSIATVKKLGRRWRTTAVTNGQG
jgi:hypothetical protein